MKKIHFTDIGLEVQATMYVKELNEDVVLGILFYWQPWKSWVWQQELGIMMCPDCLQQIADKGRKLNSR